MERPASFEVTKAPATSNTKVAHAVNTEYRQRAFVCEVCMTERLPRRSHTPPRRASFPVRTVQSAGAVALKVKVTLFDSFGPTVTICSLVP